MLIKQFANRYRLKVAKDECGDLIIKGKRGHLYFDGESLCLMILDTTPVKLKKLKDLVGNDGTIWQGDIYKKGNCRMQDVEVRGISTVKCKDAIHLAKCKARKKVVSEATLAALAKGRAARAAKIRRDIG